ncbi:CBS domain-containing protein [Pantoea allii]|uniref:CBS domain-containing protein n=1 Tax=Pantoea allii TaxID=574096 RepID=A0ABS6VGS1_9GAMM|nr:CBS domain-containing protein [Pantoea allii]MBW1214411.1 CBS domain-containing protein [Pantoea allii]MBW1257988.1 CBS domain-containing protein [Pantoea allii]MBW1266819.1 CBS domain-containing protein [Pantoea allii]MBW1288934.1 CBS domain-containing protein [Pantoea allii]
MQELAVDLPARLKLADHTVTKRVIILTLRGLLPGAGGAFGAIALLKLIALMTNVFWYKQFSFAENPMPGNASALHILAAPVIGSLIIGAIARFVHHIVQEYTTDMPETTKARQIMSTSPATLDASLTLSEVIERISERHAHHHYPVVVFLSVVSRKDRIHWQRQNKSPDSRWQDLVEDEKPVSTCPDTLCSQIADYIFNQEIGIVVVTVPQSGKVVGVITRHDIFRVRYLARQAEHDKARYLRFRTISDKSRQAN